MEPKLTAAQRPLLEPVRSDKQRVNVPEKRTTQSKHHTRQPWAFHLVWIIVALTSLLLTSHALYIFWFAHGYFDIARMSHGLTKDHETHDAQRVSHEQTPVLLPNQNTPFFFDLEVNCFDNSLLFHVNQNMLI